MDETEASHLAAWARATDHNRATDHAPVDPIPLHSRLNVRAFRGNGFQITVVLERPRGEDETRIVLIHDSFSVAEASAAPR